MITITYYYLPECGSLDVLPKLVAQAVAAEGVEAAVQHVVVTPDEAAKLGIRGSPTVRINGVDIDPDSATGGST